MAEKPTIENLDYNDVTYESVVLSMEVTRDNGSAITDCGFRIQENGLAWGNADEYSMKYYGTGSSNSKGYKEVEITGLKPDTEYHFAGYAVNGMGENETGRVKFRTEEFDCPHTYGVYTHDFPDAINYYNIEDENQHKEVWYYNYYCSKCGELVEEDAISEDHYKSHTFVDNICKYCNYAKGCTHEHTYKEYYTTTYTDITEETHDRHEWYYLYCSDCGIRLKENQSLCDDYNDENHTFVGDVCSRCQYARNHSLSLNVQVDKTHCYVGDTFTIRADGTGGTGTIYYGFELFKDGYNIDNLAYDKDRKYWTITAVDSGEYYAEVYIRDANSNSISAQSDTVYVDFEEWLPSYKAIGVSTSSLSFTSDQSAERVTVYSDVSWTASVNSGGNWLSLDKTEGYGDSSLTINAAENTTGAARSGVIAVYDQTGTVYINVSQDKAEENKYLNINSDLIEFGPAESTNTALYVSSNASWTVRASAPWISVSPARGRYDSGLTVRVEGNDGSEQRTGIITITTDSLERQVTVRQNGDSRPTITGLQSNYNVYVGEKLKLSGVIYATDNGHLNRITIKRNLNDGSDVQLTSLLAYGAETFDLGSLASYDVSLPPFNNEVGTQSYIIYASADNFTTTDNKIGEFSVTVAQKTVNPKVDFLDDSADTYSVVVRGKITSFGSGAFEECGAYLYDANSNLLRSESSAYQGNNTGIYSVSFSGLDPNTVYKYRLYIKTSNYTYQTNTLKEIRTTSVPYTDVDLLVYGAETRSTMDLSASNLQGDFDYYIQANKDVAFVIQVVPNPRDGTIKTLDTSVSPYDGVNVEQDGNSILYEFSRADNDYSVLLRIYDDRNNVIEKRICVRVLDSYQINFKLPRTNDESKSVQFDCFYSDQWFSKDSYAGYNHNIAKLALGLAVSAYTATNPEEDYGTLTKSDSDPYYNKRIANIKSAYRQIGINDTPSEMVFYNYEVELTIIVIKSLIPSRESGAISMMNRRIWCSALLEAEDMERSGPAISELGMMRTTQYRFTFVQKIAMINYYRLSQIIVLVKPKY